MNMTDKQLVDVYGVWYKPWWHSNYFYIFCALVIIGVSLLLLYYVWQKFVKNKSLPYDQVALLDIQMLLKQKSSSQDQLQDAYFTLTMILKKYLSKRYNIDLLNKTDQEIVEHIKPYVPVEVFAILQEFFERAFQIKFAQEQVSINMLKDDIHFAQQIIEQTSTKNNSAVEGS